MRRCIYKKIHYLTFDLDLGVKVTRNVTQYPLHHVISAPTKFEVATSYGLGEDTITRNVTDGRTDRQTDRRTDGRTTDRLWYEINIPYFSYEKAGIKRMGPLPWKVMGHILKSWDNDPAHTGHCKRTGGCYNELVVAFFSTGGGVKGRKIYTY